MNAALVIMAAGMGSRYGGNKQIDGVGPNNEILMQYGIFDAVRAGFDKIVFIIKPELRDLMNSICYEAMQHLKTKEGKPVQFLFAEQTLQKVPDFYEMPADRIKPLGTCHAVLCAKDLINEPFCVINADDYYGVDAYKIMYEKLQSSSCKKEAAMVGYLLENTVTEHGTVSRGVCGIEDSKLVSIKETLKIQLFKDGTIADIDGGQKKYLTPDTIVSMNFWGFQPGIYDDMQLYFEEWIKNLTKDDIKAECQLPSFIWSLISNDKLNVSVLTSKDQWFGMTYHEDRERVVNELKRLHMNGTYPEKLFV